MCVLFAENIKFYKKAFLSDVMRKTVEYYMRYTYKRYSRKCYCKHLNGIKEIP